MSAPWTAEDLAEANRLRSVEKWSSARIAEFFGRTRNAVIARLSRANGRMRYRARRGAEIKPDPERQPYRPGIDPIPDHYNWFHGHPDRRLLQVSETADRGEHI